MAGRQDSSRSSANPQYNAGAGVRELTMNEGAAREFANWKVKDAERRIKREQKKKIPINSRAVEKEQLHRGFHNALFETYGVLGKQEDSLQQKLYNQSQKRQAEACRAQETSGREHEDTRRFQFHNRNQNYHTTRILLDPAGDIQSIPESRASGDKPRDRNSRRKATPRTYPRHVTPSIQVDPEARVYLGSRGVENSDDFYDIFVGLYQETSSRVTNKYQAPGSSNQSSGFADNKRPGLSLTPARSVNGGGLCMESSQNYTISRDNVMGEKTRQAKLLADYGKKQLSLAFRNVLATNQNLAASEVNRLEHVSEIWQPCLPEIVHRQNQSKPRTMTRYTS